MSEVLAIMRKNNWKNILALGLVSSAMLLAGCDKVEAKLPTNNPILDFGSDGQTIYNNTEKQIYEALVSSGDTNSEKVLNNVLYIYSQSVFGPFFGDDGLKAVATSGDNAKIDAFAASYSAYEVKKDDGSIDAENTRARVLSFYDDVLYRINEIFFGYVKDSSYQERNQFFEEKFYKAQIKNYYKLPTTLDSGKPYKEEGVLIDGSVRLDETDAASDETLKAYFKDIFAVYSEYIEIAVLPDIYRKELTAQYLLDENYSSTVRNVAARKVDYITLPADSNNNVRNLLNAYDTLVIKAEGVADEHNLTYLDALYKGVDQDLYSDPLANSVYGKANWKLNDIDLDGDGTPDYKYYEESQFGDICEKYKVILEAEDRYDPNFETQWNSFTSNGTYSPATGFEIKRRELLAKNETTYGWYTPGGLSSLPESLRNRIFKTQVANEMGTDAATAKYNYLQKESGHYYLIPKDAMTSDTHPYIVKDGSNFTIVEVKEAVKSSKLDSSKDDFYGVDAAYRIAHKIAYSLSSSDTWVKAAKGYYVEKMSIIYHDEYVLDYFKTTFPDLFD